jgi:cytochrome P450
MTTIKRVPGHLVLGNLSDFRKDTMGFMSRIAETDSPVVRFRLLHMDYYLLNSLEGVNHVLVQNHKNYYKGGLPFKVAKEILGNGLPMADFENWKKRRKIMNPVFHKKALDGYAGLMQAYALRYLDKWSRHTGYVDIAPDVFNMTMEIGTNVLFGKAMSAEEKTRLIDLEKRLIATFIGRVQAGFSLPLSVPTPGNRQARKLIREVDAVTYKYLRSRLDGPDDGEVNMLDLLLMAKDEDNNQTLNVAEIMDEVRIFTVAAVDTSAATLSWLLYFSAANPGCERKAREELRQVAGDRLVGFEDLPKLRYINNMIQETMRLAPPAWLFSRSSLEADVIDGCLVPKGTNLFISPYNMQNSSRYWPEPEKFDPDRFDVLTETQKSAYFPFGEGPRKCIGYRFAMMEIAILYSVILQKYAWTMAPGYVPVKDITKSLLLPKHGLPVALRKVGS